MGVKLFSPLNLNVNPDVFCLLQCDAADDAQQVLTIDLARGTQTATLLEKDDTGSDVNNDSVNARGMNEGVSNVGEDAGASEPVTDVQTKTLENTEHEENGAVIYEPKTSTSPPQKKQVRRQSHHIDPPVISPLCLLFFFC